ALGGAILGFSDQQVVTGFSILIGGYVNLDRGISSYHWQIVSNLAWFSTITHLITLTSLKNQIRSNDLIKWMRIVFMGVLLILLTVAIGPTGYLMSDNYIDQGYPARCLYRPDLLREYLKQNGNTNPFLGYNAFYICMTIAILVYGYLTRVFALCRNGNHSFFLSKWLKLRLEETLGRLHGIRDHNSFKRIACRGRDKLLLSIYAQMVVGQRLYRSQVWEFTWLSFAFIWGILRIFNSRHWGVSDLSRIPLEVTEQEKSWGFGQVVAIALLLLPATGFIGKSLI
ncbi:hypothetical protein BKA64DRAFT_532422, partial [Cadophora sp. MPI-SDFR-AT-0126]